MMEWTHRRLMSVKSHNYSMEAQKEDPLLLPISLEYCSTALTASCHMSVLYLKKWKVIRLRGLWTGYWSTEILDNLIKQRAYFGQDQSTKFNEALTFRDGICHLHDPDDERKHLLKFCPPGAWLPSPWLWSILALVSRKPWKMSWAVMGDVIKYINLPSHSTKNTYSTREESQAGVFPLAIQHIDCL